MFFNLFKDLCKLNEGWSRSVSIPVGSESAGIYDLDGLQKKYSCRCQILRSKEFRCAVSRKVFFNLFKDLCKLNEGWSRSVSILVGSESAGIFDLGGLRKKYSCRCQIFFDLGGVRKSTHVVVKFCAQKSVGVQFHEKCLLT